MKWRQIILGLEVLALPVVLPADTAREPIAETMPALEKDNEYFIPFVGRPDHQPDPLLVLGGMAGVAIYSALVDERRQKEENDT